MCIHLNTFYQLAHRNMDLLSNENRLTLAYTQYHIIYTIKKTLNIHNLTNIFKISI